MFGCSRYTLLRCFLLYYHVYLFCPDSDTAVESLYLVNRKSIRRYIAFTSSETQFLLAYTHTQTHTHTHTHTHTLYYRGPAMEEKETHFSLVNTKSWMCHSVLSAVQSLASADDVYITHVCPPWHTSMSEIGDIIYIMCHLISAPDGHRLFGNLHFMRSTPLAPAGQLTGRFPDTEEHALLYNTMVPQQQH